MGSGEISSAQIGSHQTSSTEAGSAQVGSREAGLEGGSAQISIVKPGVSLQPHFLNLAIKSLEQG
jgi:hypothetical protein